MVLKMPNASTSMGFKVFRGLKTYKNIYFSHNLDFLRYVIIMYGRQPLLCMLCCALLSYLFILKSIFSVILVRLDYFIILCSNTGFHLPNLICTKLLDEEGSSSEDRSFEAVTPEHESADADEQEGASQVDGAKHRLVFEEVNGDLEMEDVAPASEAGPSSAPDLADARCTITNKKIDSVPPLPDDKPPTPPPLPSSPPPLPRPSFQGSQVQGALHVAADRVEPDNLRVRSSVVCVIRSLFFNYGKSNESLLILCRMFKISTLIL